MHIPCGCSGVGSGRSTGMLSRVSPTIFMSLRLAPSTASPTGTPLASTNRLRLTPFLARSVGFFPVFSPPERGLGHAPVHAQPGPVDAPEVVELQEARPPELQEDAGGGPLLEPVVGGGGGADAGGVQRLPLAAGVQEEEDGVEAVAVGPGRAAAAEAVGVDALRQVVAQLLPQVVGDEPLGGRRLQLLR